MRTVVVALVTVLALAAATTSVAATPPPLTAKQLAAYTQIKSIFKHADEIAEGSHANQIFAGNAIDRDATTLRAAHLGTSVNRAMAVLVAGAPNVTDGTGGGPSASQIKHALQTLTKAVSARRG